MKNIFLSTLFFLSSMTILYSQNKEYIVTEEDNRIWINNFQNSSKKNRLYLLNNRILADTIIAKRWSLSLTALTPESREKLFNSEKDFFKDKIKVDNKILIIYYLKSTRKYVMYYKSSNIPKFELLTLTDILAIENIENFEIIEPGAKAEAIYGSRARFGVVQVFIKKDKKFKEIEKTIASLTKHKTGYN